MAEYDEYNFDDDDDEEEEFEKKIYIDDDDDEEEQEDEEGEEEEGEDLNEYEEKKQEEEYEEEEAEEEIAEHVIVDDDDDEEDVSDYEIKPKTSTSKKRGPKKSTSAAAKSPPKKKPRKSSVNSTSKSSAASETTTPIKMPIISETNIEPISFNGIPSAQENLKKKQIKQWCFICPLCSKTAYNKQTFEQHLLLHDDFLTVLQVYYGEEDPVQCLNEAMEEWKVVETEYLKQDYEPEWMKHTTFKKDVVLFKNKYYEYEEGKRMLYRMNAVDSFKSKKTNNITAEEQLKWRVFDELLKEENATKKNK